MEKTSYWLLEYSFILLFLAFSTQADITSVLIPNYDKKDLQLKAFDIRNPLVLSCNVTINGEHELSWEKDGVDVTEISELKNRYEIIQPERKFIIKQAKETDAGSYSCILKNNGAYKNFTVVANVAVSVPHNIGVVEGEKITIRCTVVGTNPNVTWRNANNENITYDKTTDRYILEEDKKIKNAILIIENATLDDRGEYICQASNAGGKLVSDKSVVRIKGKLAALWPFLGICAEVFVLCAIILIYEKRRNKTELDESDTDPNTEQEKLKPQRN